jgi:hypothetical protein
MIAFTTGQAKYSRPKVAVQDGGNDVIQREVIVEQLVLVDDLDIKDDTCNSNDNDVEAAKGQTLLDNDALMMVINPEVRAGMIENEVGGQANHSDGSLMLADEREYDNDQCQCVLPCKDRRHARMPLGY